jgi:hypothetical protein
LIDNPALPLDAIAHALFKTIVCSYGPGKSNYGYTQVTTTDHVIKSGEDFLVGQVAHRSEQN